MPPDATFTWSPSTPSTVPTCLPSEPFTSMCSLICEALIMAITSCCPLADVAAHKTTRQSTPLGNDSGLLFVPEPQEPPVFRWVPSRRKDGAQGTGAVHESKASHA